MAEVPISGGGVRAAGESVLQNAPKRIGTGLAGPGRPKGTPSKWGVEVRAAAHAIVNDPEYRELLAIRLKTGEAPHMETLLWHYAYGKPKESVEIKTVEDFGDLSPAELQARSIAVAQTIIHIAPVPDDAETIQ